MRATYSGLMESQLEPYFEALKERELNTVEVLEGWLLDKSELEAVLEEDLAMRYIRMNIDPAIAGGGRYDNLAGSFTNKKLPGVGISIGLTRMFGKLLAEGRIEATVTKTRND